jgi:predicted carbohydrate-binding protein with CBM5 and CBM33 domain
MAMTDNEYQSQIQVNPVSLAISPGIPAAAGTDGGLAAAQG